MMMYHHNRLIKPYEHVGPQKTGRARGVVGIIEADFLQPTHNKQDFDRTAAYWNCLRALAKRLDFYVSQLKSVGKMPKRRPGRPSKAEKKATKAPDQLWVQCDSCLKWRKLPSGSKEDVPDKWYCYLNQGDPLRSHCDAEEESWDDGFNFEEFEMTRARRQENKRTEERKRKMSNLVDKAKARPLARSITDDLEFKRWRSIKRSKLTPGPSSLPESERKRLKVLVQSIVCHYHFCPLSETNSV